MIDLKNGFFKITNAPFEIEDYLLYSCISGSNAYGTATENSDIDLRGIFYLPDTYVFGLLNCNNISSNKEDIMYYSIKKFFELAIKNNSHALELLFLQKDMVKFCHPLFQKLIDENKYKFLSKRIGYTFGSYAFQQVKLIFTKKTNNTGRQELIQKYFYDPKMAMHSLRLLRMGTEVLTTGELNVFRPDFKELLEIRNGKYKLHELVVLGTNDKGKEIVKEGLLAEEFQKFYNALESNELPEEPNFVELNELLVKFQKELYKERK